MSVQLQIEELPGYLVARFIGEGEMEEIWQRFGFIAEECKRANRKKLLADFTGHYGPITFVDRYFLGEKAQVFARHAIKVVTLARSEQLDPQRFGELVARNRGVNVRVFSDVRAALEWVLE
jgi:hypothetical protein